MPFDTNNTVHPFLCYKYSYTIRSPLASHPEQLVSFALQRTCNHYLSIVFLECMLHQLLYPPMPLLIHLPCQWVNIPGTDPKSPAFPQFICPQVLMNTTLCLSIERRCILAGFPTSCLCRHVGVPMGLYPTIVFLHAIFWVLWCKKKITNADAPMIWLDTTLSRLIGAPTSIIPTIFTLNALPAAILPIYPGLGQTPSMPTCIPRNNNCNSKL